MGKYFSKDALIRALLEAGRVGAIALIPILIDMVGNDFAFDWRLILATAIIAELKFFDKYIHSLGKELDNETLKKGITRF